MNLFLLPSLITGDYQLVGKMVEAMHNTFQRRGELFSAMKERSQYAYLSNSKVRATRIDIGVIGQESGNRNTRVCRNSSAKVSWHYDVSDAAVFPGQPQAEFLGLS